MIKKWFFLILYLFIATLHAEEVAKEEAATGNPLSKSPLMMVWLVVDAPDGKQVFNSDSDEGASHKISELAREKHVQIVLPLMDLKDMSSISVDDILNQNQVSVVQASARYNPNAILMGSAETKMNSENKPEIKIHWLLTQNNMAWNYQSEGVSLEQAVYAGVKQAANSVAKHMLEQSTNHASLSQLSMTINDVKTIDRYVHLVNYLKNLPMVEDFAVRSVGHDYIVADIVLHGKPDEFNRVVLADHMLKVSDSTTGPSEADFSFIYQMVL